MCIISLNIYYDGYARVVFRISKKVRTPEGNSPAVGDRDIGDIVKLVTFFVRLVIFSMY